MAQYNFYIVGSSLVMQLAVTDNDFPNKSMSFQQPSCRLTDTKIRLFESGNYYTALEFSEFGTIGGVAPSDLNDAFNKLLILIENFNTGGASPQSLVTDLKPIVIHDPYGQYFTDLPSALTCINQFNFPNPSDSYYNTNSKRLYLWYTSDNLEDMYIGYNSNTEYAFGVGNNISIQDESGFIYGFSGNAFQDNNKTEYSDPIKLKVFYSTDDNAFVNCHSDVIIEQCYINGANFASNFVGNLDIKFGVFNRENAFAGVNFSDGNILTIKHLDYVGGINFANGFAGKIVIESISNSLLTDCPSDMFATESSAILHLPFYTENSPLGLIAVTNIQDSLKYNQVIFGGEPIREVQLQTNAKPIQILDLWQEYFSDLESAMQCLSNFNFPYPQGIYYNPNSRNLTVWYPDSDAWGGPYAVSLDSSTGLPFCYNNHVVFKDPSAFVGVFAGSAFALSIKNTSTWTGHEMSYAYFPDDGALAGSTADFEFSQGLGIDGNDFAYNATGNIEIGDFNQGSGNRAFYGYSSYVGSKLSIKNLISVGSNFCQSLNGVLQIDSIDSAILSSPPPGRAFQTLSKSVVYLPYEARETPFGIGCVANLQETIQNNQIIFGGESIVEIQRKTGLKPIIINDPYQEYFTDLDSASTCISSFGFPFPAYSYYNTESRKFYCWYTSDYIQTINVSISSIFFAPIGVSCNVNIQDESGFITSISDRAFSFNYWDSLTSIDNIFKQVLFPDDLALSQSNTNFRIEDLTANGVNFCGNGSTGNIEIDYAYFTNGYAFNNYATQFGNKLMIKNLFQIGSSFCNAIGACRIDILHIDPSIVFDSDSFTTANPISLHIPAIDISLTSTNYTQLQANITNTDSVIIRD